MPGAGIHGGCADVTTGDEDNWVPLRLNVSEGRLYSLLLQILSTDHCLPSVLSHFCIGNHFTDLPLFDATPASYFLQLLPPRSSYLPP